MLKVRLQNGNLMYFIFFLKQNTQHNKYLIQHILYIIKHIYITNNTIQTTYIQQKLHITENDKSHILYKTKYTTQKYYISKILYTISINKTYTIK